MADVLKVLAVSLGVPSLTVGQTTTAKVSMTVESSDGAADDDFVYSLTSSAPTVATVKAGVVTAIAPGTATITATSGSLTASATVTVTALTIPITAEQEKALLAAPVGSKLTLRGPTATIDCTVGG